jgi:hypothetical protein
LIISKVSNILINQQVEWYSEFAVIDLHVDHTISWHAAQNSKRLYQKNILDMFLVGAKYLLMIKQEEGGGRMLQGIGIPQSW